jgi:enamine deaminase RidA (YjgF/YER057c/UK114 family)
LIERFPGAVATRSKAVVANGLLYMNIAPSKKVSSYHDQMADALAILGTRLVECGSDKRRLVSVTVFIADIHKKDEIGRAWDQWVDRTDPPIRACIGATLEGQDLVELSAIAVG